MTQIQLTSQQGTDSLVSGFTYLRETSSVWELCCSTANCHSIQLFIAKLYLILHYRHFVCNTIEIAYLVM